jgi:hypothetical protein
MGFDFSVTGDPLATEETDGKGEEEPGLIVGVGCASPKEHRQKETAHTANARLIPDRKSRTD